MINLRAGMGEVSGVKNNITRNLSGRIHGFRKRLYFPEGKLVSCINALIINFLKRM